MKTDRAEILDKADKLILRAEKLIPKTLKPDLPPTEMLPDVPAWYDFEYEIWGLGEEIQQTIQANPKLRKDDEIYRRILKIATNRNAKRGRQAFVMLFDSKLLSKYASELMTQIDDPSVDGHVIKAVQKMRITGFENEIKPFCEHKTAWIRNAAKKYLTQKND